MINLLDGAITCFTVQYSSRLETKCRLVFIAIQLLRFTVQFA